MSKNYDTIAIFPIYDQFYSFRIAPNKTFHENKKIKIKIFINSNLLFYKNWIKNYKISNTALAPTQLLSTLLLWVKVQFFPKSADFLQKKMLTLAKLRQPCF